MALVGEPGNCGKWLAAAAAHRGIVEHQATGAAGLQHTSQAIATGLDHLAAFRVAACAGHAHALVGHFTLAQPHGEVVAANRHPVHHAAAAAHAALKHRAQVLHHAAGNFVVARTGDFHAAVALLHFHGATGHS